ncbi:MAG: CotH kinase family protein, partial [Verrucomicrobiales bacterium]
GTNTIAVHGLNTSTGSSDFSIDVEVRTPPPGELAIGQPTPGSANTVFSPAAPPITRQVKHEPKQPVAGQPVTISAKVTDPDGVASVTLSYQLVEPGNYIRKTDPEYEVNWNNLPMEDDDGDDIFTVNIPGTLQVHRRLVRYRITVTDTPGNSLRTPLADDESPNFAYFCYNEIPDWKASKRPGVLPDITYPAAALDSIAVYHLISRESDVTLCQWTGPTDSQYRYLGTWVYDGIVYDHIRYRIRGNASVRQVGRNKWKINFNRAHPFAARDNYGRKYGIPWDKINVLPGSNPWWRNNASTDGTMFCESAGFRLYQLAGGIGSNTHFFHFRVIDNANEAPANDQYGGDFWGMYIAIEQPEAEFLNERGLPDGNIYNVHGGSGSSLRNQGATQVSNKSDLFAFQGLHNSSTSQARWQANLDFESYFAFNAINLAINNSDMRPQENINYYHNSETDKWHILPWDIDLTFEDAPHLGRGDTSAWERIYNCLRYTPINQAYENKVREILDLLLDNDQAAHLVDEYAGLMTKGGLDNLIQATQAMWDFHPRKRKKGIWYANHNPTLLPSRDFASLTQYTKDFLTVGGYGRSNLAGKQTDNAIPNRPVISYTGPANFPANALSFASSAFSDPGGAQSFGKIQWRIGQVHNPSTPGYVAGDRYVYEIETAFVTGEMTSFTPGFTFPGSAARPGATYRARVRHIDNTGRASNWSQPVEFTASTPDITPWQQGLLITEIMYHPLSATTAEIASGFETSDFEWIELTNIGNTPLNLDNLRFTKGIDFDFADGTIHVIAPGERILVVRNATAFASRHGNGMPVAGEFPSDKLDNAGENLKLSFGAGTAIHEFAYGDDTPWPSAPDGEGFSLVLINSDTLSNPADPSHWRASVAPGGSPNASDAITFTNATDTLVSYTLGAYPAIKATLTPEGGILISYNHILAADDAIIGIETSTNGTNWKTATSELVATSHNGDGTGHVTLQLTEIPVSRQQFIRLRISLR